MDVRYCRITIIKRIKKFIGRDACKKVSLFWIAIVDFAADVSNLH